MAFNTKEQEIIKYGLQNGKTKEEVTQAIVNYRTGVVPTPTKAPEQEGQKLPPPVPLAERIGSDFLKRGQNILDQADTTYDSVQKAGGGTVANVAGYGQIAGRVAGEVAGGLVNAGLETGKSLINKLNGDNGETLAKAGEDFMNTTNILGLTNRDILEKIGGTIKSGTDNLPEEVVQSYKNFFETIGLMGTGKVLNTPVSKIPTIAKDVVTGVKNTVSGTLTSATKTIDNVVGTGENLLGKITPESSEIMNRVARLTPKQANDFKRIAGKSQGEYLVETGNFGSPDKIITKEAEKFLASKKDVDTALEGLQGNFQDGSVKDALSGLLERANATSAENIKSPYLKTVEDLIAKHDTQGLTMSEINEAKRLYERNVKLGYTRMLNPKEVELATNIDTALREWQVSKAKELGFDNIAEMNKQTQISKNLIDSLGKQLVGQEQINSMGLTDWIMLSGGDTTSVAGLLTKKLFSNKSIQSKIAKMLSSGDVKLPVKPVLNSSKLPQPQQLEKLPISSQIKVKASNTDTISNTSKRTIKETVPQKEGTIQKLINSYKALPNKQGGFVRLPFSNKIVKAIDEMTKKEIYDLDKYLGNSLKTGETNKGMEKTLDLIMEKFEISPDLSVTQIRTKLRKLMDNTKTR